MHKVSQNVEYVQKLVKERDDPQIARRRKMMGLSHHLTAVFVIAQDIAPVFGENVPCI